MLSPLEVRNKNPISEHPLKSGLYLNNLCCSSSFDNKRLANLLRSHTSLFVIRVARTDPSIQIPVARKRQFPFVGMKVHRQVKIRSSPV